MQIIREDAENDRTTSMPLVGCKVKGVYENWVFVGSISYFNTQLQEYLVKFDMVLKITYVKMTLMVWNSF